MLWITCHMVWSYGVETSVFSTPYIFFVLHGISPTPYHICVVHIIYVMSSTLYTPVVHSI